jgi:phosphatidylglycerol:prolipoprotein diacylglycerol transferase
VRRSPQESSSHGATYGRARAAGERGDGHKPPLYDMAFAIIALALFAVWRPVLSREPGLEFKLLLAIYLLWRLLIDGLKSIPYAFVGELSGVQLVCAVALILYLPLLARQLTRLRT